MIEKFNNLDKSIRILLFIPIWGWIVSALYRIFLYDESESKNTTYLIVGIFSLIFGILGFILSILDLVSTITQDKVTFLAE